MSLLESPSLQPISSIIKSDVLPNSSYVLSINSLGNQYAASTSSPSNTIHLFDKSTLQTVQTLSDHNHDVTSLRTIKSIAGSNHETLLSSGKDGCVKTWDERSGSVGIRMMTAGRPRFVLSCDASNDGLTVAGGTDLRGEDAVILYWDPRSPASPLYSHLDTHADDITAVHFLKNQASPISNVLLSASSDGLLCVSNTDERDDDEAVLHVGNWGCSISQAGWINSPSGIQAWAASDMETFSCWSSELDNLRDQDIRLPSVHDQGRTWVTDYIIAGHNSNYAKDTLGIFVGSNEGDIALISSELSNSAAPWTLHGLWTSGHVGVVRSVLWDEERNVIVTGGEDAKINLWPCPPLEEFRQTSMEAQENNDTDVDMVVRSPSRKRELDSHMDVDDEQVGKRMRR